MASFQTVFRRARPVFRGFTVNSLPSLGRRSSEPNALVRGVVAPTAATEPPASGFFFASSFAAAPPSASARALSSTPPPRHDQDFEKMTNEELEDTGTIPGWDLIHSPPRTLPRGALVGTVVSDKMQKTVNVVVDRYRIVPKIRKRVRYTRKFMAHDEEEVAKMGDLVMITPCHRISKHKHFMLREIVRPKGQL